MKVIVTKLTGRASDPSVHTLRVELAPADRDELRAHLAGGARVLMRLRPDHSRDRAADRRGDW